jgi:mannose-1-phosphate guanylyltransferase
MQLDVLLLAAGLGTRLRPLTLEIPKALLPIYGVPLLDLHIERLLGGGASGTPLGGMTDGPTAGTSGPPPCASRVVINAHHLAGSLSDHIVHHPRAAQLVVSHEPQILGTGGAIRRAAAWLNSDPFLVLNSDALFPMPGRDALAHHGTGGFPATMILAPSPVHPNVLASDGRVTAILRDRVHPDALTYTGCCLLSPVFHELLPAEGFHDLRDAFDALIARGRLGAWILPDDPPLVDVGTPARYLAAHRACTPATAAGYGLRLPAAGITLAAGSGFIAAGAAVGTGAEVRDSIVMAGASIAPGVAVCGTIVGPGTTVAEDTRDRLITRAGWAPVR